MKAAVVFAVLGLASVGTAAAAAAQATDMDYLKASRCRGIAVGLGADASGLDAFVKAQSQGRPPYIVERADEEFARAKRQAHGDGRDRLAAELSGACAAYAAPVNPSMGASS